MSMWIVQNQLISMSNLDRRRDAGAFLEGAICNMHMHMDADAGTMAVPVRALCEL